MTLSFTRKRDDLDALYANDINELQVALENHDVSIGNNATNIANHVTNTNNPHNVTKAQVGLSNVDNTSDVNKPVSAATQAALDKLAPAANVLAFGADPTGNADSTTAFYNAIATGLPVIVPAKCRFAVNLVLTTNGTVLVGQGVFGEIVNPATALVPWDTTKPVIQVAGAGGKVSGIVLDNITLAGQKNDGTYGQFGLKIGAGANRCFYRNVASVAFSQRCVRIEDGVSQGTYYQWFNGLITQPKIDSNQAGFSAYSQGNGGGWYVSNANLFGQNVGYALEIDGIRLDATQVYVQAFSGHGIKFTKSGTTLPQLQCANVTVDSDNSTDILVETYDTNKLIGHVMTGNYFVDGYLKMSDASTVDAHGGGSFPDGTHLINPLNIGSIFLGGNGGHYSINDANLPSVNGNGLDAHVQAPGGSIWLNAASYTYLQGVTRMYGGMQVPIVTTTAHYAVGDGDHIILANASSLGAGGLYVTLPTAASAIVGRRYTVVNIGAANPIHIDRQGSQTINGSTATYDLTTQWSKATVVTDGSNWFVI